MQAFYYPEQSRMSPTSSSIREQADQHFKNFSWPQGKHTWPSMEHKWQQTNFTGALHNNHHLDQFLLQDLITNGEFASDIFPTNGESVHTQVEQLKYIEDQYERSCLEESFKQQSNEFVRPGYVKTETGGPLLVDSGGVMADQFGK